MDFASAVVCGLVLFAQALALGAAPDDDIQVQIMQSPQFDVNHPLPRNRPQIFAKFYKPENQNAGGRLRADAPLSELYWRLEEGRKQFGLQWIGEAPPRAGLSADQGPKVTDVGLSRVALVVRKSLKYFSKEKILDLKFLNALAPETEIKPVMRTGQFEAVSKGKLMPSCKNLEVRPIRVEEVNDLGLALMFPGISKASLPGEWCSVQLMNQCGYAMVMKWLPFPVKPISEIFTVSCHYELEPQKTLVVTDVMVKLDLHPKVKAMFEREFFKQVRERAGYVMRTLDEAP